MISDKLTHPRTHLNSDDITANQKVLLFDIMQRHGATRGFAYNRFFQKGFDLWELTGITNINRDFLLTHIAEIYPHMTKEETIPFIEELAVDTRNFYQTLGRVPGLKSIFQKHIGAMGMSNAVVFLRYNADNFRPYERMGIRVIIQQFENEVPTISNEGVAPRRKHET